MNYGSCLNLDLSFMKNVFRHISREYIYDMLLFTIQYNNLLLT